MTTRILVGIDVGTTESKVLVTTLGGDELLTLKKPTQWLTTSSGLTSISAWTLVDAVIELAAQAVDAVARRHGSVHLTGIGITGMAESGVAIDPFGIPQHEVIAWFDPRGSQHIEVLPPPIATVFAATTGLPLGPQVTLAKLLWLIEQGIELADTQWLHVPELVAYRLTGNRVSEMSLLARTGLFKQESETLWQDVLQLLGVSEDFIPPQMNAGEPVGVSSGNHCPPQMRNALVTIAGHDHPVAAVGCRADGEDVIFDSFGTAEVFLRSIKTPLSSRQRAHLVDAGINVVRSVHPGSWHLLAGIKSGLLMRRTLALLGVDADQRRNLDDAAMLVRGNVTINDPLSADGLIINGAANRDGVLQISAASDTVGPAELWLTVVRHGIDVGNELLAIMCADMPQFPPVVVAGGWIQMESVRQEKRRQFPQVSFSSRAQAGAFGAAAFAAAAVAQYESKPINPNESTRSHVHSFINRNTSIEKRCAV